MTIQGLRAAEFTLAKVVVAGAINWDINIFIDNFPRRGEQVAIRRIARVPGGKAGNAVVAAARLLGENRAAILGALGDDSVAGEHLRIFKQEGVNTVGLKITKGIESGKAYIIIDKNGENIIHSLVGANTTLLPNDLEHPTRRHLIENASLIAIMDPPLATCTKLARKAKRSGKTVVWDPGLKSRFGIDAAAQLLRNVDYLLLNQHEVRFLTRAKTEEAAASKLSKVNGKLRVVMKQGPKGCVLHYGGKRTVFRAFDLKALGLKVVNTVGCGDTFLGAFAAALVEHRPESEALRWASVAAGLKATRPETRGSPDRHTLMKHLE